MPDARQQLFFDFARLVTAAPERESETHSPQKRPREPPPATTTGHRVQADIRGRVLDAALT